MAMVDLEGELERQYIRQYLHERGYDQAKIDALPETQRRTLLAQASEYAGDKLAEVEARMHFISALHHTD